MALNFSEPLTLFMELFKLLLLLTQLLLVQLFPLSSEAMQNNQAQTKALCVGRSFLTFIDSFNKSFMLLYLALLERLSSLGLCLDPVPKDPATVALVLLGCWCKTSSSLAVVPSVSSLLI